MIACLSRKIREPAPVAGGARRCRVPLGSHIATAACCRGVVGDRAGLTLEWIGGFSVQESDMGYKFPPNIKSRVGQRMASGEYGSEDEVLRDALRALDDEQEDLAAVQEAITEWRAGDEGMTLHTAVDSLRKKHLP
jgi:putative addiction module CopG family antidote